MDPQLTGSKLGSAILICISAMAATRKVQFQVITGLNWGQSKVFQTKSVVGSDLDDPGVKDAKVVKESLGFVILELAGSDCETIGTQSIVPGAADTFGWIRFPNDKEWYISRAMTFNTNGGRVYLFAYSALRALV